MIDLLLFAGAALAVVLPGVVEQIAPYREILLGVAAVLLAAAEPPSWLRPYLDADGDGDVDRLDIETWAQRLRRYWSRGGAAALIALALTGCGVAVMYVHTEGGASVEAGVEGVEPLRVESDGSASVAWDVGTDVVFVRADGCYSVQWGGRVLAEGCADARGSPATGAGGFSDADAGGSGDGR